MQTERLEARASASLLSHPRVGVVVPKYRRNIVDRNRTKRQLRELARTRILPVAERVDVLLRAKPEAYGASFDQLTVEVDAIAQWASGFSLP
jgi:ribonuclease P protein component